LWRVQDDTISNDIDPPTERYVGFFGRPVSNPFHHNHQEDIEMKKSKIRINPATMEISIKVSDSFMKKLFQKLTEEFPKSKILLPMTKSVISKTKPIPKVKAVNGKKTNKTPVVKGKRGVIKSGILEAIKKGKDGGVSVMDIVESTGLDKSQVYDSIKRLKSKGIVKSTRRGNYTAMGKPEVTG
jgi:hypothetical protein